MNIKQYIQNTQSLILAGLVNQKNFSPLFNTWLFEGNPNFFITVNSATTTKNIKIMTMLNISSEHDYLEVFLSQKYIQRYKNNNIEVLYNPVNTFECRKSKPFTCYRTVILQ